MQGTLSTSMKPGLMPTAVDMVSAKVMSCDSV